MRHHNNAFSLIELTIVLMIVVVIAFLGGAHMGFISRMLVVNDMQHIKIMCERARTMAVATGVEQKIVIDELARTCVFDNHVHRLASSVCFGVMPGVKGPPSKPTYLLEKPITFDHNQINFYSDGIVSSGTLYLTDRKKNYQCALSCGVSETSLLRMYRYEHGKWVLW